MLSRIARTERSKRVAFAIAIVVSLFVYVESYIALTRLSGSTFYTPYGTGLEDALIRHIDHAWQYYLWLPIVWVETYVRNVEVVVDNEPWRVRPSRTNPSKGLSD